MLKLAEALKTPKSTAEEKQRKTEEYINKSIAEAKKLGKDTATIYCESFPAQIAKELKDSGYEILNPRVGKYMICL